MTDDEYRDLQRRGQGARAVIDSEEGKACFAEVEADLMRQWADTRPWRPRRREQLYAELRGLRQVKARLCEIAQTADYEFKRRQKQR